MQTRRSLDHRIVRAGGNLSHAEVARIKAFMSRTTDRFRSPYGMRLLESPRQCVFAGTVNHGTYLRDETGGLLDTMAERIVVCTHIKWRNKRYGEGE